MTLKHDQKATICIIIIGAKYGICHGDNYQNLDC